MQTITIVIKGGAIHSVQGLPTGDKIIIMDFDVDEDYDTSKKDEDGEPYQEIVIEYNF